MGETRASITAKDIALVGMMVAVIESCKAAMTVLPNIELTSFWLILFTLCFGRKVYFVIPVFVLLEGMIYGFGLWWVMYLYAWPLLVLVVRLLRGMDSPVGWAVLSGVFGLMFGALCAIPYVFIGAVDGLGSGFRMAFAWWVAGIPWDLVHGAANFVLMLGLYRPLTGAMITLEKWSK